MTRVEEGREAAEMSVAVVMSIGTMSLRRGTKRSELREMKSFPSAVESSAATVEGTGPSAGVVAAAVGAGR
jgi:hypothetical protein